MGIGKFQRKKSRSDHPGFIVHWVSTNKKIFKPRQHLTSSAANKIFNIPDQPHIKRLVYYTIREKTYPINNDEGKFIKD